MELKDLSKEELINLVSKYKNENFRLTHAVKSILISFESQLNTICKLYNIPSQIKIELLEDGAENKK